MWKHSKIDALVHRMIKERWKLNQRLLFIDFFLFYTDRKPLWKKQDVWQLTNDHCKIEFLASTIYACSTMFTCCFVLILPFFCVINQYRLPLNFYIVWLPIEGLSVNWLLNYAYQVIMTTFEGTFLIYYVTLTMVLTNHKRCEMTLNVTTWLRVTRNGSSRSSKNALTYSIGLTKCKCSCGFTFSWSFHCSRRLFASACTQ